MLDLKKFRVTDFRSVENSGWIEATDVTALIGTNESGKTNILLALWKLNPAVGGRLVPTQDFPRHRYSELRSLDDKPTFIRAHFEVPPEDRGRLAKFVGCATDAVATVEIHRDLAGLYSVNFPSFHPTASLASSEVVSLISVAKVEIAGLTAKASEANTKNSIVGALERAIELAAGGDEEIDNQRMQGILDCAHVEVNKPLKTSAIIPRFRKFQDELRNMAVSLEPKDPADADGIEDVVIELAPKFIYYSQYGNLDSEIYLPHVIENMGRTDLGSKEGAKAQTLRVLFDFVRLKPDEILALGRETAAATRPTSEEIQLTAEQTKERDILLQSASADLTTKFRDWWKQGDYRFRFQADGNHFRIWVSDDRRPEDIELEGRSAGLQWFLSFFLVFLVEQEAAHARSFLLLDEPGLSLHPHAQKDLSDFFRNLAGETPLMYTTHSPFLVDDDHLERVRAVFVNGSGRTEVSPDLRAGAGKSNRQSSVYPVHAALGLSSSSTFLVGCEPFVVEGPSDQHYLSAIKTLLIASGKLTPRREIVFLPAGGVRGVKALAAVVSGKGDELPIVILDGDKSGRGLAANLRGELYAAVSARVLLLNEVTGMKDAEVEDLLPPDLVVDVVSRYLRGPEEDFGEAFEEGHPIVPQVEQYAARHEVVLEKGWKVEVAKRAKVQLLGSKRPAVCPEAWSKLFTSVA